MVNRASGYETRPKWRRRTRFFFGSSFRFRGFEEWKRRSRDRDRFRLEKRTREREEFESSRFFDSIVNRVCVINRYVLCEMKFEFIYIKLLLYVIGSGVRCEIENHSKVIFEIIRLKCLQDASLTAQ